MVVGQTGSREPTRRPSHDPGSRSHLLLLLLKLIFQNTHLPMTCHYTLCKRTFQLTMTSITIKCHFSVGSSRLHCVLLPLPKHPAPKTQGITSAVSPRHTFLSLPLKSIHPLMAKPKHHFLGKPFTAAPTGHFASPSSKHGFISFWLVSTRLQFLEGRTVPDPPRNTHGAKHCAKHTLSTQSMHAPSEGIAISLYINLRSYGAGRSKNRLSTSATAI